MHHKFFIILITILLLTNISYASDIEITNISTDIEDANEIAIFMDITNNMDMDDVLYAARTSLDANISIETVFDKKEHVGATGIEILSGQTVKLEEGGLHIALHDFATLPKPGDIVKITLFFQEAGKVNLDIGIK